MKNKNENVKCIKQMILGPGNFRLSIFDFSIIKAI